MRYAEKTYLGDGVYARFDGYHVWIWTSNGIQDSEHIAIEPDVFYALEKFFHKSFGDT